MPVEFGPMTAKAKLLERAPELTDVQAEAMLGVLKAQDELEAYFESEAMLSDEKIAPGSERRSGYTPPALKSYSVPSPSFASSPA
jgi:hypothetical protein